MLDPKTLVKGEEDKAPAKEHRKQAGSPVKPHWGQQPKGGGGRGAPVGALLGKNAWALLPFRNKTGSKEG